MTPVLTLNVTLEEAQVLAQALDLLASDPGLTSAEWPTSKTMITPSLPRWVTPPLTCPRASMT